MNENQTVKKLFNKAVEAFVDQNYDKSIELLSNVLKENSKYKQAIITRGSAYLKQNRLQDALKDFDCAIALDESYAGAFHKRGLTKEKLGWLEEALCDFDTAIDLNPDYGAAYFSRASLHSKLANEDAALADMQMVTQLGSRNLEDYMLDNNVWHTQHMRVEDAMETELNR